MEITSEKITLITSTFLLLFLAGLVLSSCSTGVYQELDPDKYYKLDLLVQNGGSPADGLAVLPLKESYDLHLEAPGGADLVKITTCHRQEVIGGRGSEFNYNFELSQVERDRRCHLKIEAYEKDAPSQHSSALIDFNWDKQGLSVVSFCNGKLKVFFGTGVCQSWMGLVQKLRFATKVKVKGVGKNCQIKMGKDKMTAEYPISKGECLFVFQETGRKKRQFRFTTVGYEEVAIRGTY